MKRSFLSSFGSILLLLNACSTTPDPSQPEPDEFDEASDCKTHKDCGPEEICFSDGVCAKPWGSYFSLTKCAFDGPTKEEFPSCRVHCMLQDSANSGGVAQWSFSPGKWNECDYVNRLQAVQHGIEVRCGFVPSEEGVDCPAFDSSEGLCVEDGCPGFSIEHYRSETFVELGNSSGYALRFLLVPQSDKRSVSTGSAKQ